MVLTRVLRLLFVALLAGSLVYGCMLFGVEPGKIVPGRGADSPLARKLAKDGLNATLEGQNEGEENDARPVVRPGPTTGRPAGGAPESAGSAGAAPERTGGEADEKTIFGALGGRELDAALTKIVDDGNNVPT